MFARRTWGIAVKTLDEFSLETSCIFMIVCVNHLCRYAHQLLGRQWLRHETQAQAEARRGDKHRLEGATGIALVEHTTQRRPTGAESARERREADPVCLDLLPQRRRELPLYQQQIRVEGFPTPSRFGSGLHAPSLVLFWTMSTQAMDRGQGRTEDGGRKTEDGPRNTRTTRKKSKAGTPARERTRIKQRFSVSPGGRYATAYRLSPTA